MKSNYSFRSSFRFLRKQVITLAKIQNLEKHPSQLLTQVLMVQLANFWRLLKRTTCLEEGFFKNPSCSKTMRTEDSKNKSQWSLGHLHMIKKKSREKKTSFKQSNKTFLTTAVFTLKRLHELTNKNFCINCIT